MLVISLTLRVGQYFCLGVTKRRYFPLDFVTEGEGCCPTAPPTLQETPSGCQRQVPNKLGFISKWFFVLYNTSITNTSSSPLLCLKIRRRYVTIQLPTYEKIG